MSFRKKNWKKKLNVQKLWKESSNIIENARLALDAEKFKYNSYGQGPADMPEMLENK